MRTDATVVDLRILASGCAPFLKWYDGFLADPDDAGTREGLRELDYALKLLRVLPPCGGRLGRAVALVGSGTAPIDAIETLRSTQPLLTRALPVTPAPVARPYLPPSWRSGRPLPPPDPDGRPPLPLGIPIGVRRHLAERDDRPGAIPAGPL